MGKFFAALAATTLLAVAPAQGATVVDQSQTSDQGAWNPLNSSAWSQSFIAAQ